MKSMKIQATNGVAALIVAIAFALVPGHAQSPRTEPLRGVVEDENGNGISGASIFAVCSHQSQFGGTTAKDGSYALMLPQDARCTVHASAPNFAQSRDVSMTIPTSTPLIFTLRVEAVTADVVVHADDEPLISLDPESNAG